MDVVETAAECRALLAEARATGCTVGFVPTMGALHAGHVSLMERARSECEVVVVSIFVNPLQFGDPEDIAGYPRTLDDDLVACARAGVDVVFVPRVTEMYPTWPAPVPTTVSVSGLSEGWEGASRPGHFDGVTTVVAKLFSIAGECRAYFGEKDYQQLAIVRRMAADLSLPVDVVGCRTVREADGLALSSRNVRLSAEERRAATVLSRALQAGQMALREQIVHGAAVSEIISSVVAGEPSVQLDYATVVNADDLTGCDRIDDPSSVRLLIAAQVGPVRLIDNCAGVAPLAPTPHTRRAERHLERIG
ncbi:MAG TPA: pantoate--beta-alanine ligase [Acidimicrobiales bacterium]|jgi:pantoate--beta-alanine ligase